MLHVVLGEDLRRKPRHSPIFTKGPLQCNIPTQQHPPARPKPPLITKEDLVLKLEKSVPPGILGSTASPLVPSSFLPRTGKPSRSSAKSSTTSGNLPIPWRSSIPGRSSRTHGASSAPQAPSNPCTSNPS